jgi:hypothetical protein
MEINRELAAVTGEKERLTTEWESVSEMLMGA